MLLNANIDDMVVTLDVSQFCSAKLACVPVSVNIPDISFTRDVSHELTSKVGCTIW